MASLRVEKRTILASIAAALAATYGFTDIDGRVVPPYSH
jgi:hypothetical protein